MTEQLAPLLGKDARVVNLSSAAQDTVNADALRGGTRLGDMAAYSQSKLALTMWSREAAQVGGPVFIAVNPGSLLASKMVKEGFGMAGNDLSIGADILTRAAVDDDFADASGKYWDNDSGRFADPHPDALDQSKSAEVVSVMQEVLEGIVG